jgi:hypothetical protein
LAVAPHRLDEDRKRLTMVTCRSPAGESFADLQHIFAVVEKLLSSQLEQSPQQISASRTILPVAI